MGPEERPIFATGCHFKVTIMTKNNNAGQGDGSKLLLETSYNLGANTM